MIVKVCGFRDPDNAAGAVTAGADWLGLNFWPQSKRFVGSELASDIARAARQAGPVVLVGVFVNQPADHIAAIVDRVGLDLVQLHGDEPPGECERFADRCIKAVALRSADDVGGIDSFPCDTILVDTPSAQYGGTGAVGNWQLARRAVEAGRRRIVLAGGLNPDNVADAVAAVAPFGVDVAGGVESAPGLKDLGKVRRFVTAAKSAGSK